MKIRLVTVLFCMLCCLGLAHATDATPNPASAAAQSSITGKPAAASSLCLGERRASSLVVAAEVSCFARCGQQQNACMEACANNACLNGCYRAHDACIKGCPTPKI